MKRIWMIFLALCLLLPGARAEEEASPMTLKGPAEELTVRVPAEFIVQRVEPIEGRAGENYTFENPETGAKFTAFMSLESQSAQQALLRRVRGKSAVVRENVLMGNFSFLAFRDGEDAAWSFLLLAPGGYSYRFWYEGPDGQGAEEIPETARKILSSLRLAEENVPPHRPRALVPEFPGDAYPERVPIGPERGEAAEQMIGYAKALLSAPGLAFPLEGYDVYADWEPGDYFVAGDWPWGGPVYMVCFLSRDNDSAKDYSVALRPDGSVRCFYVPFALFSDSPEVEYEAYNFHPGDVLFSRPWWDALTGYLTAFAQTVDPENAALIRDFYVTNELRCGEMRLLEILCQSGEERDMPMFTVEIYPEIRVFQYGIGVG